MLKQALRSNDRKDVYSQFVGVCEENGKYYAEILHKFRTDAHVYSGYGQFLYRRFVRTRNKQQLEAARDLLKRGIQNLPLKLQHVSLIEKFVWNELKFVGGVKRSAEEAADTDLDSQGEAMFQGLLKKYSNRANLWKSYALAVFKFGGTGVGDISKLQRARDIFERGLSRKKRKMQDTKWLFKQYLQFENKYGHRDANHEDNVAHIKEMACEAALKEAPARPLAVGH